MPVENYPYGRAWKPDLQFALEVLCKITSKNVYYVRILAVIDEARGKSC